jgi:hypothetical protein
VTWRTKLGPAYSTIVMGGKGDSGRKGGQREFRPKPMLLPFRLRMLQRSVSPRAIHLSKAISDVNGPAGVE